MELAVRKKNKTAAGPAADLLLSAALLLTNSFYYAERRTFGLSMTQMMSYAEKLDFLPATLRQLGYLVLIDPAELVRRALALLLLCVLFYLCRRHGRLGLPVYPVSVAGYLLTAALAAHLSFPGDEQIWGSLADVLFFWPFLAFRNWLFPAAPLTLFLAALLLVPAVGWASGALVKRAFPIWFSAQLQTVKKKINVTKE